MTPVASKAASRSDVLSTVEHVIGAVVATVSLTALAALALPGLLGLLSTCAAGIRIGYRQAKATSALPDTAISRFVGSGPVGVVRSGSQVAAAVPGPAGRSPSGSEAPSHPHSDRRGFGLVGAAVARSGRLAACCEGKTSPRVHGHVTL